MVAVSHVPQSVMALVGQRNSDCNPKKECQLLTCGF